MSQTTSPTRSASATPASPPSLQTRRQFLRTSAKVAVGLGLGLPALTGCLRPPPPRVPPIIATDIWRDLAAHLHGTLLRPGSETFKERATPWALQYASTLPKGIARCADEADVQTCLQWAQANRVPLVARSGGHSYAGYSTTTGLMIDVSPMNQVDIDAATGLAVLGGGARNSTVYAAARPLSRAITHGRCKEVGVAGLVLGGGIGFNMRAHGLTCDNLRETRIVLADGRALTCNETENAELFWACRGGGGGNFGINTSFTFQTFPVGNLTVFNIAWTERIRETFAAIQTMVESAPNTLGMKLSLVATKQAGALVLTLSILGQLVGTPAELDALLAPILAVQTPSASMIKELPYWDGQELLSEDGKPEYSHERSRFISGALSDAAVETIFSNLNAWPGTSQAAQWKYFLMGGVINDKQAKDTAFVHRGHTMLSSIELEWVPANDAAVLAENETWLAAFHEAMEPHTTPYCYQNFIDPSQKNYLNAYYGDNLKQLQAVKRQYDPADVFRYPQSIPAG